MEFPNFTATNTNSQICAEFEFGLGRGGQEGNVDEAFWCFRKESASGSFLKEHFEKSLTTFSARKETNLKTKGNTQTLSHWGKGFSWENRHLK